MTTSECPKWDMKGCALSRKLGSFEEKLMRGMSLEVVRQLDMLFARELAF
jgi:hypothetical protein